MVWKFQHAFRLESHFGNPEGADILLNMNHHLIAIEKDQVQSVKHAYGMDPMRGHNPQAIARPSPAAGGPQQAHEPAEVAIRHLGLCGYKPLAGFIVNTNVFVPMRGWLVHESSLTVREFYCHQLPRLLGSLGRATPYNNGKDDDYPNARQNLNGCCTHDVLLERFLSYLRFRKNCCAVHDR
jgi:hypothetical protein